MRRLLALLLALILALPLTGCARKASWRFELDLRRDADDYTARDGTLLSWYGWELPYLLLLSDDAAPGDEPPEELAAVRDAFNAETEACREALLREYHELEQLAVGDYVANGAARFVPTGSHVEIAEAYRTARLQSVRADGYADRGGAYPWRFVRAWSFDLETGKIVAWYDLNDDPDALRAAIAAEITRQIRAQGMDAGFYDGWEETVGQLEGCEICMGADALTVIFGEQMLGPRAAGMPEFAIPYDAIARYWNGYGRELMKKEG